ncbi:DUF6542 domain-containing protein [Saccharothrix coeruleofusca]|uniref:DUF6542 domain-containing protein n=1 Tax=Saccharothrix coeruleofusca TaxID=33919 RepID=A0A918AQZ1_9PSEU|nr:DUF6542 domain-containing protein [Saccharothrix coeruleofusca]MBP2340859.1 multisubunit Na+/H+ antiporter MnhC subunit [Saccharothrix coeruleofusca]GGP60353.1 hypothetical protein GCM10010185_35970 [Saccharothrix coeruleofusca]
MTAATRDRRGEPEDDEDFEPVRWNDRAMFGTFRGLPWWAAVLGAFALATIGTFIDVSSSRTVGWIFGITFFAGAVGAVVLVERRSMFGPVVQPPLVLAIVVPLVVLVTQGFPSGGLTSVGLTLGKPLIDGFPAMALTTACTVLIGIYRVFTQKDPNRRAEDEDPAEEPPAVVREVVEEERPRRPRDPDAPPRRKPAADADRPRKPRSGADRPGSSGRRPERPRRPRPRDDD